MCFHCSSGNQISSLPNDLFTNMPDLHGIEFSNTNVVTVPEAVFGRVMPQLALFSLEGKEICIFSVCYQQSSKNSQCRRKLDDISTLTSLMFG